MAQEEVKHLLVGCKKREPVKWPFVVASLAAFTLSAFAGMREFFVSSDGNDAADGSSERPWRTIEPPADSPIPDFKTVDAERLGIDLFTDEEFPLPSPEYLKSNGEMRL